jgi:Fur family ferric uptake transcriptional regulator
MFSLRMFSSWRKDVDERLIATGYKLTSPRRRVLAALRTAGEPLGAQELAERAGTTVASTYRALALLADLGIASEVPPPGGASTPSEGRTRRYALCTINGHHHHFVCRVCHRTLDVQSDVLERAFADLQWRTGVNIERHEVLLSGRCAHCLSVEPAGERA